MSEGEGASHMHIKVDCASQGGTGRMNTVACRYSLMDELRVLVVHGVLHLCGFDHERGSQVCCALAAAVAIRLLLNPLRECTHIIPHCMSRSTEKWQRQSRRSCRRSSGRGKA